MSVLHCYGGMSRIRNVVVKFRVDLARLLMEEVTFFLLVSHRCSLWRKRERQDDLKRKIKVSVSCQPHPNGLLADLVRFLSAF